MTWHSYSINTSRSAKSGLPNRGELSPHHRFPVHPSILHHTTLIVSNQISGKEKRGKGAEGARAGLVAVFFMMLSGDYIPWRGYISLHLLMLRSQYFISSQCRLICLLFFFLLLFFGLFEPSVNIDWPHTLPIPGCLFCSVTYTPCDPLCTAYHSLLVWPLYQQREHPHLPTSRASHGK